MILTDTKKTVCGTETEYSFEVISEITDTVINSYHVIIDQCDSAGLTNECIVYWFKLDEDTSEEEIYYTQLQAQTRAEELINELRKDYL